MRVIGLDGRTYPWPPTGHQPPLDDAAERSSYHLRARELLRRLFPSDRILEEVPLPGSLGLRADFYLPLRGLVAEVHGEQHYEFCSHWHGDKAGFRASQQRDLNKRSWVEMNHFHFVELPYHERDGQWEDRITLVLSSPLP